MVPCIVSTYSSPIATATSSTLCWPTWQSDSSGGIRFITNANTSASTATSPTSSFIYWPDWHENITLPAFIRERSEAEAGRLERYQRETAEVAEKRRLAVNRAKQMLFAHLTTHQREMVEKNGWFVIEGGKSGKLYRVKAGGIAGNIEELDKNGEHAVARYCCHLENSFPMPDHHLAQKLMLEWDEDTFLRLANKTPIRPIAA